MTDELSGFAIIICVATGFITLILLFIFGKRQIMRFALKSKRGPHTPIASDAPKQLKREIDRRLDVVRAIRSDPKLITSNCDTDTSPKPGLNDFSNNLDHINRMKAVDAVVMIENNLVEASGDINNKRPSGQDLRYYLFRMTKDGGSLHGCDPKLINQFVDAYNHARFEPNPVFGPTQFIHYMDLLNKLLENIIWRTPSRKSNLSSPYNRGKDTSAQIALNGKTTVKIISNTETNKAAEDTHETSV